MINTPIYGILKRIEYIVRNIVGNEVYSMLDLKFVRENIDLVQQKFR